MYLVIQYMTPNYKLCMRNVILGATVYRTLLLRGLLQRAYVCCVDSELTAEVICLFVKMAYCCVASVCRL